MLKKSNASQVLGIEKWVQPITSATATKFILLALMGFLVFRRFFVKSLDLLDFFNAYYPAGRLILENPDRLYSFATSIIYGFVNLPILALLFRPFSLLEKPIAGFLFTLLGVIAIIVCCCWLIQIARLKGLKQALFWVVAAANIPIFYSIWLGNSTHMLFLCLIASFVCLRAQRDLLSGIFLAITGLLKPPFLFLFLYFLLRKRFRAVLGFWATLGAVVSLSVLGFGLQLNLVWFQECILKFSGKIIAAYNAQSVDSFLIRLMTDAPIDTWDFAEGNGWFKLFRYGLIAILVGATILTILRRPAISSQGLEGLEYSMFLTLTVIISPISWTHYYLFLLLPVALYLGGQLHIPRHLGLQLMMLISILLVITPNVTRIPFQNPLLSALTRYFLVSHFFLGGVLLWLVLLVTHRQIRRVEPSLIEPEISGSNRQTMLDS
jgi:Glycosyltransferase family 87